MAAVFAVTLVVAGAGTSTAGIGGTERVSVTTGGGQLSTHTTTVLDMTPSGQHVLFVSDAPQLGVASGSGVFLRDRLAQTTTRVDAVAGTAQAGAISDDGRHVVSVISGTIRLHDRQLGTVVGLGTASSGRYVAISGDGSTVAFTNSSGSTVVRDVASGTQSTLGFFNVLALSADGRHVLRQQSGSAGITLLDRQTSAVVQVSRNTSGVAVAATKGDLSADGTTVAFQTNANNVVTGDTDGRDDVFHWDGTTTTIASPVAGYHVDPAISADGTHVSFLSTTSAGGASGEHWVRDAAGNVERAAMRTDGGAPATLTAASSPSRLSVEGRLVAFASADAGLVAGDTNVRTDLFVRDRTGDLVGNGAGTISGTVSSSEGLVDAALVTATGPRGTFTTFSASDGTFELTALPTGTWKVKVEAPGHNAAWYPSAGSSANAVPIVIDDGETVELSVGLTTLDVGPNTVVSRSGFQSDAPTTDGSASADGRYVAFSTAAASIVEGDTNGVADVFVADRQSGQVVRASLSSTGTQLTAASSGVSLSADGRTLAWVSAANGVVAGDSDGLVDVFTTDLDTGTTTRHTATVSGTLHRPQVSLSFTALSGDGTVLLYKSATSNATVRVPLTGGAATVTTQRNSFMTSHDGAVTLWIRPSTTTSPPNQQLLVTGATFACTQPCTPGALSRNGRYVAYSTDGNDVDVVDLTTGVTTNHSSIWDTGGWTSGRGSSICLPFAPCGWMSAVKVQDLRVSDDGRYVAVAATWGAATPLSDRNGVTDVFVLDRVTDEVERVSVGNDRAEMGVATDLVDLSADGRTVFVSTTGALSRDDSNGVADLYAIELDDDRSGVPGTGAVSGTVTADGGQPVAGATVRVLEGTRRVARATTAADGTWSIAGLVPADYLVKVDDTTNVHVGRYAPGVATAAESSPTTVSEGAVEVVDVELPVAPAAPAVPGPSTVVSTTPASSTVAPAVSGNGRWVAFVSAANGLIVRDRVMETERRLDPGAPAGTVAQVDISDDGRRVAFVSTAAGLVPGDTNGVADVFVADAATGALERASLSQDGFELGAASSALDLSGDGRWLTFTAAGGNLYLRDLQDQVTVLVATDAAGTALLGRDGSRLAYLRAGGQVVVLGAPGGPVTLSPGGDALRLAGFSADGARVLWTSDIAEVPGARDAGVSLYRSDVDAGTTELVDVATGGLESPWSFQDAWAALLAADGDSVVFADAARRFALEGDDDVELFVRDLDAATTVPLAASSGSVPVLSADGNTLVSVVGSTLTATPLRGHRVPSAPSITLVGPAAGGAVVFWEPPLEHPSGPATEVVVERYEDDDPTPAEVASVPYDADFGMYQTGPLTPGTTQRFEVRVRNAVGDSAPAVSEDLHLAANATIDVTLTAPDGPVPWTAVVAFDDAGRAVTFGSTDESGTTTLTAAPGSFRIRAFPPFGGAHLPAWSGGGPLSVAGHLTVTAGQHLDVEIPVDVPGTVTPLSHTQDDGLLDAVNTDTVDLSGDGRWAAMTGPLLRPTQQTNVTVFVRDAQTGALVEPCAATGALLGGGRFAEVSDDGRYVAYATTGNNPRDVVHCDLDTGEITKLSDVVGAVANAQITALQLSGDGSTVALTTTASNLVPGDTTTRDVFAWEPDSSELRRVTTNTTGLDRATSISADGTTVAVLTTASLLPTDTFADSSLYLLDTTTGAPTLASPHPVGGSAHAADGAISADGTTAVFTTATATIDDSVGRVEAYRFRPGTGVVDRASTDGAGGRHVGDVTTVAVSGDGERVAYAVTLPGALDFPLAGDTGAHTSGYVTDVDTGRVLQIDLATDRPRATATGVSAIRLDHTGDAAALLSADVLLPHETDTTSIDAFLWTREVRPAYVPTSQADLTAPTITTPVFEVWELVEPGETSRDMPFVVTATDDVDGSVPVECDPGPGEFPIGATTVTCSATDTAGNVRIISFTVRVEPPSGPVSTVAAGDPSCAVMPDATIRCWGDNSYGQTGAGTTGGTVARPGVLVNAPPGMAAVDTADHHACALAQWGAVFCWGRHNLGQTGHGGSMGTWDHANQPVYTGVEGAVAVAVGGNTSCALIGDGTVRCWGQNNYGQLGDGTTTNSNVPVPVTGLTDATQISVGSLNACARLTDGTLRCWGYGTGGALGNGTSVDSPTPVPVTGITDAVDVTTSGRHGCAALSDGTARCWGQNNYGQLGDDTETDSNVPVPVAGITTATDVEAAFPRSCAVLTDGTVRCWGNNGAFGALGDGTTLNSSVPVAVHGLTDVAALDLANNTQMGAGHSHACAVTTTGATRCWGNGYWPVPVPVTFP